MLTAREGLIALVLLLSAPAAVADLEALKAECDSCHGPLGVSAHPDVPIIAGQTQKFIQKTLLGFQLWDRPCVKSEYRSGPKAGNKTDMCKIAGALSNDEMAALAAWYSEQAFVPANQDFDPAQVAAGEALHMQDCEKCHEQGATVAGTAPRTAGQWTEYLQSTIKYFPTGEHMCPPMMERKISGYSKEQITQLLNYLASPRE